MITGRLVTVRPGSAADSSSTRPGPVSVPVCDSCRRASESVVRYVLTVNIRGYDGKPRSHSTRGAGVLLLCAECKVGERCDICGVVEAPTRPIRRFNRVEIVERRNISRGGIRLCGQCWSETAKPRMRRPMRRPKARPDLAAA